MLGRHSLTIELRLHVHLKLLSTISGQDNILYKYGCDGLDSNQRLLAYETNLLTTELPRNYSISDFTCHVISSSSSFIEPTGTTSNISWSGQYESNVHYSLYEVRGYYRYNTPMIVLYRLCTYLEFSVTQL